MNKTNQTATPSASGRGTVTRISAARRTTAGRRDIIAAREARHTLRPRSERFAHLKRMYD